MQCFGPRTPCAHAIELACVWLKAWAAACMSTGWPWIMALTGSVSATYRAACQLKCCRTCEPCEGQGLLCGIICCAVAARPDVCRGLTHQDVQPAPLHRRASRLRGRRLHPLRRHLEVWTGVPSAACESATAACSVQSTITLTAGDCSARCLARRPRRLTFCFLMVLLGFTSDHGNIPVPGSMTSCGRRISSNRPTLHCLPIFRPAAGCIAPSSCCCAADALALLRAWSTQEQRRAPLLPRHHLPGVQKRRHLQHRLLRGVPRRPPLQHPHHLLEVNCMPPSNLRTKA